MSVWLIEPRDPVIFRDGRPFNPTPGARAMSLPFPFPSTLAGAVRTRAGQNENGVFDTDKVDELREVGIRGPVLVALNEPDGWYFPAPNDCLVAQTEDRNDEAGIRSWAHPVSLLENEFTNLQDGLVPVSINPVKMGKPHTSAPRFWRWAVLKAWLERPANDEQSISLNDLGIPGLTPESRVHIKIQAGMQTSEEGMLFETSGLEFVRAVEKRVDQYALAIETNAALTGGADVLGGERRIVNWRKGSEFPACPVTIAQKIVDAKACRVLLATPALFEKGYLPKWIENCMPRVTTSIVAAAVPRYQAVSGWDYKAKRQKASRRVAPAGSVYFLRLSGDDTAIGKFIESIWMQNISDQEQDRRDGFGLALLGTWDGKTETLELEDER